MERESKVSVFTEENLEHIWDNYVLPVLMLAITMLLAVMGGLMFLNGIVPLFGIFFLLLAAIILFGVIKAMISSELTRKE